MFPETFMFQLISKIGQRWKSYFPSNRRAKALALHVLTSSFPNEAKNAPSSTSPETTPSNPTTSASG